MGELHDKFICEICVKTNFINVKIISEYFYILMPFTFYVIFRDSHNEFLNNERISYIY